MAALSPGQTLTLLSANARFIPGREEGWHLEVDGDERGRIRGNEVSFDDLELLVQRTGDRPRLVTRTGTPLLRLDRAGRKATTLAVSSARFRLARQRPRPLMHRWRLTKDVHGDTVLEALRTPFGTRLRVAQDTTVDPELLALLALGVLVELLDVEPAAAAA